MNKNYIIWGISDKGYEHNISSSYSGNVIPEEFKTSVSDTHRKYAFAFARENPNDHYFYSIEQVRSNVLYTIYRTNFKGGSVANRLAYDAATIIISKNHIIEEPLTALKSLINSYVKQKNSGIGNLNFENVLAAIRLIANNDKRSISKTYKAGYIKYNSETELRSIFVDKEDKLYNFNKVYFFTKLSLLEEGEDKIQDLQNYTSIPIQITNFDSRYYKIFVEDNQVNISGNTFNAYEGQKIEVCKVNKSQSFETHTAKPGLKIPLKEIKPEQKPPNPPKPENRIKQYLTITLLFVLILVSIILLFFEEPLKALLSPQKEPPPIENDFTAKEIEKIVFDGEYFKRSATDTIKGADVLLESFKKGVKFEKDCKEYKLEWTDQDWLISTSDKPDDYLNVDSLELLKEKIEKANDKTSTKKIVKKIDKIIKYRHLYLADGLEYKDKIWKVKESGTKGKALSLHFSKKGKAKQFTDYTQNLEKDPKLKQFLKNNLPDFKFELLLDCLKDGENKKGVVEKEDGSKLIVPKPKDSNPPKKETPKNENCELTGKFEVEISIGNQTTKLEKDYKRINKTYLKKIIKMIKRIRGTDDGKDALQKLLKEANTMIRFLEESNCKKAKDILNDASDEIKDIELEIKANIDEK